MPNPTQRLLIDAVDHLESALAMIRQAQDLATQDMQGALDYTESAVNTTWSALAKENETEFELKLDV